MTEINLNPDHPDWPVVSLDQANAALTGEGSPFETEEVEISGRPTTVWKNIPPTFADFARMARAAYADREFVVFEDERVTYDAWFKAAATLSHKLKEMGMSRRVIGLRSPRGTSLNGQLPILRFSQLARLPYRSMAGGPVASSNMAWKIPVRKC